MGNRQSQFDEKTCLAVKRNAVSHFVAKLVKSFGGLRNAAESLDDFRYRKAQFTLSRMRNSVA
jgi:hypothetical protein